MRARVFALQGGEKMRAARWLQRGRIPQNPHWEPLFAPRAPPAPPARHAHWPTRWRLTRCSLPRGSGTGLQAIRRGGDHGYYTGYWGYYTGY